MISAIKWVYYYLNYNPQVGIISAIYGYTIAMKSLMFTDQTLKQITVISAIAGCIVACLTAISWIIRAFAWVFKIVKYLKIKYRNKS